MVQRLLAMLALVTAALDWDETGSPLEKLYDDSMALIKEAERELDAEKRLNSLRKPMEKARGSKPAVSDIFPTHDDPFTNGSYFFKWFEKEISNLGSFDTTLFELFLKADGKNRKRLIDAFPDYFLPQ